jgi:hypothetical protein
VSGKKGIKSVKQGERLCNASRGKGEEKEKGKKKERNRADCYR